VLKPGYRNALLERGGVLACLGKDRESIKDYSEILRNDPKDQDARLYRAWAYAKLGELSASAEDLHWVIKHGEPEIAAYLELSYVLARMGKLADAVQANENALKMIKEGDVRYQLLSGYQRALLLLAEGKFDEARRRYAATNNEAEKALDGIAVEEAMRKLKGVESCLPKQGKALEHELLSLLETLEDRIQNQAKEEPRYCRRGYF
jgi:tetratricopeptide (TPR) repeat protein